MDVSQLKISPEALRFKPLSKQRKSQLRHENIKALIRSKPTGTYIPQAEFARVCAFTEASAGSMLKTLLTHKEIERTVIPGRKNQYSYTVCEDVKVTKPAVKTAEPIKDESEPIPIASFEISIQERAMAFAWSQNSDSLREFIRWIGQ